MKEVIDTGLPSLGQPFSWAVRAGNLVFTAHGPVRSDGSVDTGPIEDQARLTFSNLAQTMAAAGGSLDDVTQVQIQMTDVDSMPIIDNVYREYFRAPYPNRSSVVVKALVVPGMGIEIVVNAVLPG
ncbi:MULTISPECIES: RidA family protein [Burkholderia]|uniref:Endoribonuclease L-PSP n=2 Tax=Burkholderia lata (strain ATCC 17760 / DSM 23089 / LMG 22485 / NCIMB 9086 / R18194 / 383) TaxID=482957 RepID=Q38ZV1_BURL3|nr:MULTISPECIES: RidA family protein [Burkholderia]ABB13265.1 Endoribonuclease L-PSP [Burkholderia lata]KAF1035154.1 MAG: putative reactive intermediate deaminase TdcF [Burkholderia lata]MBN3730761.1 RidA family protein [Burkholderia sp. Tr-20390]